MNFNPTTNLNFNAKTGIVKKVTRFRVPGKNGTTIVTDIVEIPSRMTRDITKVSYREMRKGKVLEEKTFQNKKGFPDERLGAICDKIQEKVREGFNFLDELIKAQLKGGN